MSAFLKWESWLFAAKTQSIHILQIIAQAWLEPWLPTACVRCRQLPENWELHPPGPERAVLWPLWIFLVMVFFKKRTNMGQGRGCGDQNSTYCSSWSLNIAATTTTTTATFNSSSTHIKSADGMFPGGKTSDKKEILKKIWCARMLICERHRNCHRLSILQWACISHTEITTVSLPFLGRNGDTFHFYTDTFWTSSQANHQPSFCRTAECTKKIIIINK